MSFNVTAFIILSYMIYQVVAMTDVEKEKLTDKIKCLARGPNTEVKRLQMVLSFVLKILRKIGKLKIVESVLSPKETLLTMVF